MNASEFLLRRGPTGPAFGSATVAPSDSADLPRLALSLAVLSAGDVCFVGADGVTDTWTIPAGAVPFLLPVAVSRVKATGTTVTAGGVKALW